MLSNWKSMPSIKDEMILQYGAWYRPVTRLDTHTWVHVYWHISKLSESVPNYAWMHISSIFDRGSQPITVIELKSVTITNRYHIIAQP